MKKASVLIAAVVMAAASLGPAQAATPELPVHRAGLHESGASLDGGSDTSQFTIGTSSRKSDGRLAAAGTAPCAVTINYPHYSSGAGGVIFKTRVVCSASGRVYFNGYMTRSPYIGPGITVASNSTSRLVSPGVEETFYVPKSGVAGAACYEGTYYQGVATLSGAGGTSTTVRTPRVQLSCP